MNILDRLNKDSWFVLSACKGHFNDAERTEQLAAMLAPYDAVRADGVWLGVAEDSFLVFNAPHVEAVKLGQLFQQTHVLTDVALIDCQTGEIQLVDSLITGADAAACDGHTVVGDTVFSVTFAE